MFQAIKRYFSGKPENTSSNPSSNLNEKSISLYVGIHGEYKSGKFCLIKRVHYNEYLPQRTTICDWMRIKKVMSNKKEMEFLWYTSMGSERFGCYYNSFTKDRKKPIIVVLTFSDLNQFNKLKTIWIPKLLEIRADSSTLEVILCKTKCDVQPSDVSLQVVTEYA